MRFDALALGIASALAGAQLVVAPPSGALAQVSPHYQYLSPSPGARLVSRWNNVVIRPGAVLDGGTIDGGLLRVVGSRSGSHPGELIVSDDRKTLVFRPDQPFALGETVSVQLEPGLRTNGGAGVPALSFEFSVAAVDPRQQPVLEMVEMVGRSSTALANPRVTDVPGDQGGGGAPVPCEPSAPGSPVTRVLSSDNPDPGDLFLAPFFGNVTDAYLLIVDNLGMPVFSRTIPNGDGALDFKRQPNGLLTYFEGTPGKFFALDGKYAVVDSFATGNGYATDLHELQILTNGHALLMSYDPQRVDMSAVTPGGNPNALVIGLIVQELDTAKNVVFQWRSWDHFAITDLASPAISLTDSVIDYVHGNAIELDQDGSLLISSRHTNEITKIDRQTGSIIWRLGLNAKNNQFSFVNDTRGFSHQHDIRRLPNGHVTLFDNGNYLTPTYSRALEYDLNETSKVATLVWEYRNSPDTYGGFMGNAQRRPSGGTLVGWGGTFATPNVTDLHADGSKALEIAFDNSSHIWWSYRAFRFPWRTTRYVTEPDSLAFGSVAVGSTTTLPLNVHNTSGANVTISCVVSSDLAFTMPTPLPITLAPGGSATLEVRFAPPDAAPHSGNLYVRQVSETELVAQPVALRGTGASPTAVAGDGDPRFGLRANRPNPFGRATTIEFTLPRTAQVRLEILDLRGRLVDTLVDGVRSAGRYEVTWASQRAASGMYFCRLRAGDRTETRKLVLTR